MGIGGVGWGGSRRTRKSSRLLFMISRAHLYRTWMHVRLFGCSEGIISVEGRRASSHGRVIG